MTKIEKTCAVVTRTTDHGVEILTFVHPLAGKQFIKDTIEEGEHPRHAAERELREESGVRSPSAMKPLGSTEIEY